MYRLAVLCYFGGLENCEVLEVLEFGFQNRLGTL